MLVIPGTTKIKRSLTTSINSLNASKARFCCNYKMNTWELTLSWQITQLCVVEGLKLQQSSCCTNITLTQDFLEIFKHSNSLHVKG